MEEIIIQFIKKVFLSLMEILLEQILELRLAIKHPLEEEQDIN